MEEKNSYNIFVEKPKEKNHLEDLGVNENNIGMVLREMG
jgi:hypothetical protein